MGKLRIGTRESQLATWQAGQVKDLLGQQGVDSELVFIKSEGDVDLVTPLYEMGVQGIFTRSLDAALLNNKIDLAVHSLKDVPTKMPDGLAQASVLKRGPVHDLLVFKDEQTQNKYQSFDSLVANIATSSTRRKAQWLHRYPSHLIQSLRGNVNTRLRKLKEENWDGAIFAQAGLERIHLRPTASVVLDWMLPAPGQGAIVVVCRGEDQDAENACKQFNDAGTELCTQIEREFLRALLGGCSAPISALAEIRNDRLFFKGSILSIDGHEKFEVEKNIAVAESALLGILAADELLAKGGDRLVYAKQ